MAEKTFGKHIGPRAAQIQSKQNGKPHAKTIGQNISSQIFEKVRKSSFFCTSGRMFLDIKFKCLVDVFDFVQKSISRRNSV